MARKIKAMLSDPKVNQEITQHCTAQDVMWKFMPEHAPHFGGHWEAVVKSFRAHLRKIMGKVRLTFEELMTTLVQIEACLNSRPLIPLQEALDEFDVLFAGHFLIGRRF